MAWLKRVRLKIHSFLELNSKDKLLFIESWLELLKVVVLLRTPFRKRLFESAPESQDVNSEIDINNSMSILEKATSNHIKNITCLERALALQSIVKRRGGYIKLNIGVKSEGNGFEAHAWLGADDNGSLINEFSELVPVNKDRR